MMIDDFVADLGQVPDGFRVETLGGSHPLQMLPKSAQVQRHANSGTSAFAT